MDASLRDRLRLCLVTDGAGDLARIEHVVEAVLTAGCRCVQLREPQWTARQLADACARLRPRFDDRGAWLLVNDRVDVAASGVAHGVQLGHRSLAPDVARRILGPDGVIGCSAHDAGQLAEAVHGGADFALLSPVWPTASKPGATGLGVAAAAALTGDAGLPVVWLGGVDAARCAQLAGLRAPARPVGLAAMRALMSAADPAAAAAGLLVTW